MKRITQGGWVFYLADKYSSDPAKVGKWMHYFNNYDFAEEICEKAVEKNIVSQAKHTDADTGVACFYLHFDDISTHKKTLNYFIENKLIRRTKKGRLYDISFKLDSQTYAGEYGNAFSSDIKLSTFLNLDTEEWLI